MIVLWAFRDCDNRWCVRQEGAETEVIFDLRSDALSFARELGAASEGYCLFFQLPDGRTSRELCNMGTD